MLESVGLGDRVQYYPENLSGGQKQRVAIARALVTQPKIVLADEQTTALDKKSGREVMELMQRLAKEQRCTILIVTHDNCIVYRSDGRLVSQGEEAFSIASIVGSRLRCCSRWRKSVILCKIVPVHE
jgi:putative ABC transport system ATP-binding protein